jgi:hypothetical protein
MYARFARSGEQVVGALGPEPVGVSEGFVELSREGPTGKRRRFVDDRVGFGARDRLPDGPSIECVDHERLGAECAELLRFVW